MGILLFIKQDPGPEVIWNRSKAQALTAMRQLLSQMDGQDSNVRTLRRQLNHMFPPDSKSGPEGRAKSKPSR